MASKPHLSSRLLPLSGTSGLCCVGGPDVVDGTSALIWNVPENRCLHVSKSALSTSGDRGPVHAVLICLPLSQRRET